MMFKRATLALSVGTMAFSAQATELTIATWGGIHEKIVRAAIAQPLEKQGIKVNFLFGTSGDRLARLYAEKRNPSIDLSMLPVDRVAKAIDDGVCEASASSKNIPEYDNLYPWARQPGYGVSLLAMGIQYKPSKVSSPPKTWADLWAPQYKGKVAVPAFPQLTQGGLLLVIGAKLDGGSEDAMDAGFARAKRLKPFGAVYNSTDALGKLWEETDVVIAPAITSYTQDFIAKGGDAATVYPADGAITMLNSLCISVGTRNKEAAQKAVNLFLSQAVQEAFARNLNFGPTSKAVRLDPATAAKVPYGEAVTSKLVSYDWRKIAASMGAWADRWNREVLER
jgi:putative spermidine/putrescine transport system substrate-binding protein